MSSPNHGHMIAQQASRRRPIAETLFESATAKQKAAQVGPCDGCRHVEICSRGLACAAMALWVGTGRNSAAPKQPSRAIYERLYPEVAAV
jgi:hypothetical protein